MRGRMRSLGVKAIHSKYGINYDMTGAVYACVKMGGRKPAWLRRQREMLWPTAFESASRTYIAMAAASGRRHCQLRRHRMVPWQAFRAAPLARLFRSSTPCSTCYSPARSFLWLARRAGSLESSARRVAPRQRVDRGS
jgi:hypothetical protein